MYDTTSPVPQVSPHSRIVGHVKLTAAVQLLVMISLSRTFVLVGPVSKLNMWLYLGGSMFKKNLKKQKKKKK